MAVSTSTNLSVTIAHAISFLTRPLVAYHPASTLMKLQMTLEANLTALYAPTWVVDDPLRGSGRRCLSLSPNCLPPRAIYSACIASGVQWFDWISHLGSLDFDLIVDPGCVRVRHGGSGSDDKKVTTIWADEQPSPVLFNSTNRPRNANRKTLAQQLLEEDIEEDEQLFAMIADEVRAPSWMTPLLDQFPVPARSSSPISTYSRSSSRSSNSSSGFSYASEGASTTTSVSSSNNGSKPTGAKKEVKQSRRERARQARVFVDITKKEVTPYDGGKTTVLTGGVMLGGGPKPKSVATKPQPTMASSDSWRSIRA